MGVVMSESEWSGRVLTACGTLLVAAVAAYVAWRVLERLLAPMLLVVVVLSVYRIATRGFHRDRF
jgi:cobalamin synthase